MYIYIYIYIYIRGGYHELYGFGDNSFGQLGCIQLCDDDGGWGTCGGRMRDVRGRVRGLSLSLSVNLSLCLSLSTRALRGSGGQEDGAR